MDTRKAWLPLAVQSQADQLQLVAVNPRAPEASRPLVASMHTAEYANLLAAAPEMRWALKLALEYWEQRQQRYKNRAPVWVQEARAALAKAEALQPAG